MKWVFAVGALPAPLTPDLASADDAVGRRRRGRLNKRREGEDDGGGIAAGVGDQAGVANLVAVQLGRCRRRLRFGARRRAGSASGACRWRGWRLCLRRHAPLRSMTRMPCCDGLRAPTRGIARAGWRGRGLRCLVDDSLPGEGDDLVLPCPVWRVGGGCLRGRWAWRRFGFARRGRGNVGVAPAKRGWCRRRRASSAAGVAAYACDGGAGRGLGCERGWLGRVVLLLLS